MVRPSSFEHALANISVNVRLWPKADPENNCFLLVKMSALEKSGHFATESIVV